MADSNTNEIYLRCGCGDEVLIVEHYNESYDDEEYILSMRTIPIKQSFRTKVRKIWETITIGFNYEVILNSDDMKQLKSWIEEQENGEK